VITEAELRRLVRRAGREITRRRKAGRGVTRLVDARNRAREILRCMEPAGRFATGRARSTGTLVGLYRADLAGIDTDPELPWFTVCEDHSALVGHGSRAAARDAMLHPESWCGDCRTISENKCGRTPAVPVETTEDDVETIEKGKRVRVSIKRPETYTRDAARVLDGLRGTVAGHSENPGNAGKHLVEFDEPAAPIHSSGRPVIGFWFDVDELTVEEDRSDG